MRPTDYGQIMQEGWEAIREDYRNEKLIGWRFMSSLYEWANRNGRLVKVSETDVEGKIRTLEGIIYANRRRVFGMKKNGLERLISNAEDWEKRQAAEIALTMDRE